MFPDATIHVTNIWKKRLSFTLLEEFSHIFKQTPKTKIYAEARLSQSGLSKHKIKQTLNIACSSVCKTEMFSLVSPAQNAEIESLGKWDFLMFLVFSSLFQISPSSSK